MVKQRREACWTLYTPQPRAGTGGHVGDESHHRHGTYTNIFFGFRPSPISTSAASSTRSFTSDGGVPAAAGFRGETTFSVYDSNDLVHASPGTCRRNFREESFAFPEVLLDISESTVAASSSSKRYDCPPSRRRARGLASTKVSICWGSALRT